MTEQALVRPRVLLCVMPFVPLERPALGVSLLKSLLSPFAYCEVLYGCHQYSDEIGFELYRRIAQLTPTHHLAGDWVFTRALYGEAARPDADFEDFAYADQGGFYNNAYLGQLRFAREQGSPFLDKLAEKIAHGRFDVVGFSSTFQQNVASLALARRLKEYCPSTKVVFGGANCESEMGVELMRQFPQIDFVCRGESDVSFPMLICHLAGLSEIVSLRAIPGLVYRENSAITISAVAPMQIENLDDLPLPDHSDFVESFERSTASLFAQPELTAETSRGCWWGAKHHCTFCGLNGLGIGYRSKTPSRAVAEIRALHETYGIDRFFFTDNILDLRYFNEVFPALEEWGAKLQLFYETKANLRKEQLLALRRLGTTWLQPGIENLNSHVLQLMKKGVRGIQNVQTMKWAKQYGFLMTWNLLCGFPGETPEDYDELVRFMRSIYHLPPPSSFAAFRLDRFSPMHDNPTGFGLRDVTPYPTYQLCYPTGDLSRLAYFFTYRSTCTPEVIAAINRAWTICQDWKENYRRSVLAGISGEDFLLILDTRPQCKSILYLLSGHKRAIYEALDAACSLQTLLARLRKTDPGECWEPAEVQAALDEFEAVDLVLREDELYLALAILADEEELSAFDHRDVAAPALLIKSEVGTVS